MPYVPREVRDGKRTWVNQSPSNVMSCGPCHRNSCASRVSFDRVDRFIQSRVCLFVYIWQLYEGTTIVQDLDYKVQVHTSQLHVYLCIVTLGKQFIWHHPNVLSTSINFQASQNTKSIIFISFHTSISCILQYLSCKTCNITIDPILTPILCLKYQVLCK